MFIVIVESHDLLLQSPIFPREVPLLHRHKLPHLHCKRQIRDFVQQKLHAIERGNLKSDEKNGFHSSLSGGYELCAQLVALVL